MKLLLVILSIGMLSSTSYAFMGKSKGKGDSNHKKMTCKDKKGESKISCWSEKITHIETKQAEKLTKLSTLKGKKFEKRKAKTLEKLSKRIEKTGERLTKVQGKIAELNNKAPSLSTDAEALAKLKKKIMMKEAHAAHINKKTQLFTDFKQKIEALNN